MKAFMSDRSARMAKIKGPLTLSSPGYAATCEARMILAETEPASDFGGHYPLIGLHVHHNERAAAAEATVRLIAGIDEILERV